jgi:mRNA interferase RelE/StbE
MFKVFISPRARRDLKKVPEEILPLVAEVIDSLEFSFYPEHRDVKKLRGLKSGYRIRIGDWRILYFVDFEGKAIYISNILPRKGAY